MTNFAEAIEVKRAQVAHKASASNLKKFDACIARVKSQVMIDLLTSCNVQVTALDQQIYTLEKIVKFAALAFDNFSKIDDLTHNTIAIFKTAKKFADAKVTLTAHDVKCAIAHERHMSVKDAAKKALIVRRIDAYAVDSTINAQSQSSRAALEVLNVIKETAKDCFTFDAENAISQALIKRFDL